MFFSRFIVVFIASSQCIFALSARADENVCSTAGDVLDVVVDSSLEPAYFGCGTAVSTLTPAYPEAGEQANVCIDKDCGTQAPLAFVVPGASLQRNLLSTEPRANYRVAVESLPPTEQVFYFLCGHSAGESPASTPNKEANGGTSAPLAGLGLRGQPDGSPPRKGAGPANGSLPPAPAVEIAPARGGAPEGADPPNGSLPPAPAVEISPARGGAPEGADPPNGSLPPAPAVEIAPARGGAPEGADPPNGSLPPAPAVEIAPVRGLEKTDVDNATSNGSQEKSYKERTALEIPQNLTGTNSTSTSAPQNSPLPESPLSPPAGSRTPETPASGELAPPALPRSPAAPTVSPSPETPPGPVSGVSSPTRPPSGLPPAAGVRAAIRRAGSERATESPGGGSGPSPVGPRAPAHSSVGKRPSSGGLPGTPPAPVTGVPASPVLGYLDIGREAPPSSSSSRTAGRRGGSTPPPRASKPDSQGLPFWPFTSILDFFRRLYAGNWQGDRTSYKVRRSGASEPGTGPETTQAHWGAGFRRLDAADSCLVRVTVKAKPETECSSKGGSVNVRVTPDKGSVSFSCGAPVNTLMPSLATAYYGQDCSETQIPLKAVAEGATLEMNDSSGVYTLALPTMPLKPLELCYLCAESLDSDSANESCKVRISVEGAIPGRAKESTGGASVASANIVVLLAVASLASWAA